MTASRGTEGTGIVLVYGPGCGAIENAVFIGTGPMTGAPAWTDAFCALDNTGEASFDPGDPPPGSFLYFVIVGQSATTEGSYGQDRNGATLSERAEAAGIGDCDRDQDLSGICP